MSSDQLEPTSTKNDNAANSLTFRVLTGLFWTFSSSGVQAVLRIVVLVFMARLLTPEDFGLVGAASIIVGLATFFFEFGISSTIEQRPQLEERHLRTAFTIYTLFGLLIGGLVVLSAPLISSFFQMDNLVSILQVIALIFPIQGLTLLPKALLRRNLHFRWIAGVNVFSYAIGSGLVGIGMAMLGFGVWALVDATLAQAIISAIILLLIQPYPKRPQFEREALNELIYFGGGFTVGRFLNYVAEQGDNVVVGRWLGADALGVYGRAYQLLVFPVTLFGTALDLVLFPSMSRVQHDAQRLATVYRHGVSLIALIMLPVSVVAMVLAPEIIQVLLGPQWVGVVLPFQILAAGMLFRASYRISDSVARATGAVYRRAWRLGLYALLTVSGALVGQFWGVSGVAAGVLVALTINFIVIAQLSLTLVAMPWRNFLAAHLPAVLLTTTTFVTVWAVTGALRNLAAPALVTLVVATLITGLVQLALLYLLPQFFLGQDGKYMLETLKAYAATKSSRFEGLMPTKIKKSVT